MSKRGRPRKPRALKIIDGTYRSDREPKIPLQPDTRRPKPARYLDTRGKQIFESMVVKLEDLGLASATYTEALNLLCLKLWEVEHFREKLREGYTYQSKNVRGESVLKTRPEVELLKSAVRDAKSLLVEFGLTPSSMRGIEGISNCGL